MITLNPKSTLIIVGGALAVFLILRSDVKQTVKTVGNAVNPLNQNNIIYTGVSSLTPQSSLGSWLYDWSHPTK